MEGSACRPLDLGPCPLLPILDGDRRCDFFWPQLLVRAGISHGVAKVGSEHDPKRFGDASLPLGRPSPVHHDKFRSVNLAAVYACDYCPENSELVDRSFVAEPKEAAKTSNRSRGDSGVQVSPTPAMTPNLPSGGPNSRSGWISLSWRSEMPFEFDRDRRTAARILWGSSTRNHSRD